MSDVSISVVSPVFGCADCLASLCQRLTKTLRKLTDSYEIILVNDGSFDNAWDIIKELAHKDNHIKGINLSRNFGQHLAIVAGLDHVAADWVVVMDCDLQDRPEEIAALYRIAIQGYDQVIGIRGNRKDSWYIRTTSKLFYLVFNYLSGKKLDNRAANFGIYSRKVIDSVKRYKEKDRSFGLLASLVGFKRTELIVEHTDRRQGKSSYSFRMRLNMAINHVLSYSNKPLMLVVKTGFFCSLVSSVYAFWLVLRYLLWAHTTEGWTSVMVSLFFLSGLIITVIGMVGIYIGKIFNEVKNRPLYLIDETTF